MTLITRKLPLFLGTFASSLLVIFGLGTLLSLVVPVAIELILPNHVYHPQLPLSANRAEAFIDVDSIPAKNLYPPLTNIGPTESGDWIRIPAIDINVPLALSPSLNDKDILETLSQGAALYPNGISPGHLGNTFVSAHSTGEPWKGKYRFAFLKINQLEPGHLLHLDYQGTRYTYRLTNKELIKPTADYRVVSNRPVPTVTLMACWPLWSTNQRQLIHADLTNITKLTPRPI